MPAFTYLALDCCSSRSNGSLLDIQMQSARWLYSMTTFCPTINQDGIYMTWDCAFPHKLRPPDGVRHTHKKKQKKNVENKCIFYGSMSKTDFCEKTREKNTNCDTNNPITMRTQPSEAGREKTLELKLRFCFLVTELWSPKWRTLQTLESL